MVLKQNFQTGRTNYTDIGNDWMYTEFFGDGFSDIAKRLGLNDQSIKDCKGFIDFNNDKNHIPIYKDFEQSVYSDDGKLFLTLVSI